MAPTDAPGTLLKVIFVGDSGVGKTCLIERMFSNTFNPVQAATIGVDQRFKRMTVDGRDIGFSVWDTAGQERFQSITSSYYRGAHGVVFCFDVTRRETFDSLENKWLPDFAEQCTRQQAVAMVVGNKVDMDSSARQVSSEEGAEFARAHGCLYKETSAKADTGGVDEGVYDALVWGMVCTILDTPGLAAGQQDGSEAEAVRVDGASPFEGRHKASGCC
jgi:Ras-related protein Rab-18